jgi:ribosomal protein L7Ae-like RNA K-turn-binding protein
MRKFTQKEITIRSSSSNNEYEFPSYLKTSWTSLDNDRFASLCSVLRNAFGQAVTDPDEPREYVIGTKSVLQYIERSGMNILCVIACIDNGGDVGLTSRMARVCYMNGIPLVMGRGPRQLGAAFGGKKRVCCVALTKMAASNNELFDFIMNLSSLASQVSVPLEDVDEIKGRFMQACQPRQPSVEVKRPAPKTQSTPPKKQNTGGPKKGIGFFASFE